MQSNDVWFRICEPAQQCEGRDCWNVVDCGASGTRINSVVPGTDKSVRIDALQGGGFAAVWVSNRTYQGTNYDNVYARRFDNAGDPIDAADVLVDGLTSGAPAISPDVAILRNDTLGFVWQRWGD